MMLRFHIFSSISAPLSLSCRHDRLLSLILLLALILFHYFAIIFRHIFFH